MKTPSKYQHAIFEFIQNSDKSIVVQALAGSGKSSTIIEALKYIPSDKSVLMVAFNKSIADELATKVTHHTNVTVKTFNALGHGLLPRMTYDLSTYKAFNLIEEILYKEYQVKLKNENPLHEFIKLLKNDEKSSGSKTFGDLIVDIRPECVNLFNYGRRCGVGVILEDSLESWDNINNHYGLEISIDDLPNIVKYVRQMLNLGIDYAK